MKEFSHYISFSILIGVIVLIALNVLVNIGTGRLLYAQEKNIMEQKEQSVQIQNKMLINRILSKGIDLFSMSGNYYEGESGDVNELQVTAYNTDSRIILLGSNYEVIADTYERNIGQYIITEDTLKAMRGEKVNTKKVGDSFIQVMSPIYDDNLQQAEGIIITLSSIDKENAMIADLQEQKAAIGGLSFLISAAFCVIFTLFVRYCFRDIQKEMNVIASGHDENRLSEDGFLEFYRIGHAFNKITDRYKELENSRQEFVSNVSHELKTPITSMKILADSLLMQENVPIEIYEEFMNDIVHEIDRENQIITDLLELVRMDKKAGNLNVSATNINDLLEELLRRITPIALKRNITIHLETMRQVVAEVDRGKLSLACNNLIENAVKYNNDGGMVNVYLNADHKFFYIRVKDNGVGIPEDSLDRIFERFYRVDKARSRETGGTGLGLAITRNVVLLHKGSIRVHSKEGEETTFIIRIPLNYVK